MLWEYCSAIQDDLLGSQVLRLMRRTIKAAVPTHWKLPETETISPVETGGGRGKVRNGKNATQSSPFGEKMWSLKMNVLTSPKKNYHFLCLRVICCRCAKGHHSTKWGKQLNLSRNDIVYFFLEVSENTFGKGNKISFWLLGIHDLESTCTALFGNCKVRRKNSVGK